MIVRSRFRVPPPQPVVPPIRVTPAKDVMRVIVQYTPRGLKPQTRAWGEANGAEFRDTSADDEAWYRLIAELWDDGEAFMLVDHDIVPPERAVKRFIECPRELCSHPFITYNPQGGYATEEIGCTRFSKSLIQSFPGLVEESVKVNLTGHAPPGEGPRHWHWIAVMLRWELRDRGVRYHPHWPAAEHILDKFTWLKVMRRELRMPARDPRLRPSTSLAALSVVDVT